MKTTLNRWLLSRKLRAIKHEIDYLYQVRRETVRRESALKAQADFLSYKLMSMELVRHD